MERAQLTEAGRLVREEDEVEVLTLEGVGLDAEEFSRQKLRGTLRVTNRRAVWIAPERSKALALRLRKVTKARWGRQRAWYMPSKSARLVLVEDEGPGRVHAFSLRERRPANLLAQVQRAIDMAKEATTEDSAEPVSSATDHVGGMGLGRLLREDRAEAERAERGISEVAGEDIEQLRQRGQEMASIARRLKEVVGEQDEEVGSILSEAGLGEAPSSSAATKELARQIADLAAHRTSPLPLPEAFCLVNRSRGTSLVSPREVLKAARAMHSLNLPAELMSLPSGALAIAPPGGLSRFARQAGEAARMDKPLSEFSVAASLDISPALAKEVLLQAERELLLARDDCPQGLLFYPNFFFRSPAEVSIATQLRM